MFGLEEVVRLFEEGYSVAFGDCWGEDVCEDVEDVRAEWDEVMTGDWLYIESVEVDHESRAVVVMVGDDE